MTREWFGKYSAGWAESHSSRVIRLFERDIFPWIGGRPIAEITAAELLPVMRRIETRGAVETAHRARTNCSQVFRYAVATGRCQRDPSTDLRGALPPVQGEHFAATTEPSKLAGILRAMDGYEGNLTVRCALRLAPLVFVRPEELRSAEWKDFDLEAGEWRYTVTKTKTPHIVPLSRQAVEILRELQPLTGHGRSAKQQPRLTASAFLTLQADPEWQWKWKRVEKESACGLQSNPLSAKADCPNALKGHHPPDTPVVSPDEGVLHSGGNTGS